MRTTPNTHNTRVKIKRLTPTQVISIRKHMSKDITTYTPISIMRIIAGVGCITAGLVTWFVPMTTLPLLTAGGVLLGYDCKALYKTALFYIKEGLFFIYRNRNLKGIKRTINWRLLLCF